MSRPDPPEHYRWAHEFVDVRAERRRAALQRHRQLLDEERAALGRVNQVWARVGKDRPTEPHLVAEMDQANSAWQAARQRTFYGAIHASWDERVPVACRNAYLGYAVLFLRWERSFPDEWYRAGVGGWSRWGTKAAILGSLGRHGVPASHRSEVIDLVVAGVGGPYRCEDWGYAAVARRVDGEELRGQLRTLIKTDDPLPPLRAEFLLYVLDHPDQALRRTTWHRWIRAASSLAR